MQGWLRLALAGWLLVGASFDAWAELAVVQTAPASNTLADPTTDIVIDFDRAVDATTLDTSSLRVFGRWSGARTGATVLSNGDTTLTFTPDQPFSAGELVTVNLSHDLMAADATPLRSAGYAFQFLTTALPSLRRFSHIGTIENGASTRLYGANAADFDGDSFLDLATINENSADVRVYLNKADGSGTFEDALPPVAVGAHASPNEAADFNNDGLTDLCVGATDSDSVWVLLGAGDGTFSSVQEIEVGDRPHGVAVLDVDGDGDWDIVAANQSTTDLSLMINDGAGVFGPASSFEGGVDAEYGLAAGELDGDGILDLAVTGRDSMSINGMLGNGDGTFTPAASSQDTGGRSWVVVLGDVNGDALLDAATANSTSGSASILLGNGDGTFGAAATMTGLSTVVSTDLGDLDGDGDPEWVVSSFGGRFWRVYENDGSGNFAFDQQFTSPGNASCAVLYDADNDGDLDMALTDEIDDVILLQQNRNPGSCTPEPMVCKASTASGKSQIELKDQEDDAKDRFKFKWGSGEATALGEFGDPTDDDTYSLCVYEGGGLIYGAAIPAGGTCGGKDCWQAQNKGFRYKDNEYTPDGVRQLKLKAGATDGKAQADASGKGERLVLPALDAIVDGLEVQLQREDGGVCLGATFTPPFQRHDAGLLKARSD